MTQSEYQKVEPYFPFFKDDVDLSITEDNQLLVKRGHRTIVIPFQEIGNELAKSVNTALDKVLTPEEVKVPQIISLFTHPKGTYDFYITYEDGERAKWFYHNNQGCPFFQAFKRSFPNFEFGSVGVTVVWSEKSSCGSELASISHPFCSGDMDHIKETKQPFKTTITFL